MLEQQAKRNGNFTRVENSCGAQLSYKNETIVRLSAVVPPCGRALPLQSGLFYARPEP